jgi:hypothetical protein
MNDAHLADAGAAGLVEILAHHPRRLLRPEAVEIEDVRQREGDRLESDAVARLDGAGLEHIGRDGVAGTGLQQPTRRALRRSAWLTRRV